MGVKKVAAIIVAALVAGVVLGSFGIADAGPKATPDPAAACADCSVEQATACDMSSGTCPTSTPAAPAPAAGQCDMSSGNCADCQQ